MNHFTMPSYYYEIFTIILQLGDFLMKIGVDYQNFNWNNSIFELTPLFLLYWLGKLVWQHFWVIFGQVYCKLHAKYHLLCKKRNGSDMFWPHISLFFPFLRQVRKINCSGFCQTALYQKTIIKESNITWTEIEHNFCITYIC